MALSVAVEGYGGVVEERYVGGPVWQLCQLAAEAGMPMLGLVAKYDDTKFNRSQIGAVAAELRQLAATAPPAEAEAAHRLLAMTERVDAKPHRYLVFIGD
ncbi:MAG TPA: hypothetical protein VNQ77_02670 [Frankiaceae bacterium]|nr:hypothetical protein [Frankiaceae bacterium]